MLVVTRWHRCPVVGQAKTIAVGSGFTVMVNTETRSLKAQGCSRMSSFLLKRHRNEESMQPVQGPTNVDENVGEPVGQPKNGSHGKIRRASIWYPGKVSSRQHQISESV